MKYFIKVDSNNDYSGHPIKESNLRQAFPSLDFSSGNPAGYLEFIRVPEPKLGPYEQFDESKVYKVKEQSLQENVNQHTYIYKENKDNVTHLYLSCNGEKSKSIMLYAPKEEKNIFKKRYLAIQENLDKYELFYSGKAYSFWKGLKISNIYIVNRKENKVFSWKIKVDE